MGSTGTGCLDVLDRSVLSSLNAVLGAETWSWRMPQRARHARPQSTGLRRSAGPGNPKSWTDPSRRLGTSSCWHWHRRAGSCTCEGLEAVEHTGCSGRNADAFSGARHVRVLPQHAATQLMVLSSEAGRICMAGKSVNARISLLEYKNHGVVAGICYCL